MRKGDKGDFIFFFLPAVCDSGRVSSGLGSYSSNCQGTEGRTGPGLQRLSSVSPATHRDTLPFVEELEQGEENNVWRM